MGQKYDANLIVIGTGDPIAEFVLAMRHGLGMNKILGTFTFIRHGWKQINMRRVTGRKAMLPSGY